MLKRLAVLLCLVPTLAFAGRPQDVSEARAYALGRHISALADGSRFVTYYLPQGHGTGAAIISTKGGVLSYLTAADWIPAGAAAPGTPGTIFAGDLFPDGKTLVVTYAWNDPSHGRASVYAVAVLKRDRKENWTLSRNIYFGGNLGEVVAGPGNLILVLNQRYAPPGATADYPLLSIVDTDGNEIGAHFRNDAGMNASGDWSSAHLLHVDANHYALLDPFKQTVRVFDVDPKGGVNLRREVSIATLPQQYAGRKAEELEIRGFHVNAQGDVIVARQRNDENDQTAVLTNYAERNGKRLTTQRVLDKRLNTAFSERGLFIHTYGADGLAAFDSDQPDVP